jgi:hypothetical protein
MQSKKLPGRQVLFLSGNVLVGSTCVNESGVELNTVLPETTCRS